MSFFNPLSYFLPSRPLTPVERLALVEVKSQEQHDNLQGKVRQCDHQIQRERFMARDLYARNKPEEAFAHNHAAARANANRRRLVKTQERVDQRAAQAAYIRSQLEGAEIMRDMDAAIAEALPNGNVRELEQAAERQSDVALQLEDFERKCDAADANTLGGFEDEARAEANRMQAELAQEFRNQASTLPQLPAVMGQPAAIALNPRNN